MSASESDSFIDLPSGDANARAAAPGDTAGRLIGTWRLVSHSNPDHGPRPTGLLYYDANGFMAVQIMFDVPRPKYAGKIPTPDEAKAALTGYTAYFGTYAIDEAARTITHRRAGNVNPGGLGDFVRRYEFISNDRVALSPLENTNVLTWERIK
jgi:hypothetical protein